VYPRWFPWLPVSPGPCPRQPREQQPGLHARLRRPPAGAAQEWQWGFLGCPPATAPPVGPALSSPGQTFLGSLTPVDNLTATVCTGTPDAAAVDPTVTYGATVVYDSSAKTLAAWLTKGSTTGGGDITQKPVLQQGSVDLCALLTPGAAGAAPTGSFYLGFTATAGDCSADPGSCTASPRALHGLLQ